MYKSTLTVFLIVLVGCNKVPPPIAPEIVETTGDAYQEQSVPAVQNEPFNFSYDWKTSVPIDILISASVAAQVWESIIIEGLPDVNHRTLGHIDDLLVSISMATRDIEGPLAGSNTLATARPILARSDSLRLPCYGEIIIYPALADTARYTLEDQTRVIMHELGHVLGFTDGYLERVGTETIAGVRYFNGVSAAEGYKMLLYYGLEEKLSYAIPGLRVPLMNDSPHWRWPALNWELMSPFAGILSDKVYITHVTILAMKDLGYVVDGGKGETPPFNSIATKMAIAQPRFMCDGHTIRVADMRPMP